MLRRLYTEPGVDVVGYGDDDLYEVLGDIVIGRIRDAAVSIRAEIGGRRTFALYWRNASWVFKVNNEWAQVVVDGELIPQGSLQSRVLRNGSIIEIRHVWEDRVIHRFAVGIG